MNTNPANKEIQHLKSQIAALEQLLEVYEKTVLEQSDKLYKEIADRKHMEAVLRESEEKFRVISTSAKDAIIMMNNDGIISFWNEAAEKIFKEAKEEGIPLKMLDIGGGFPIKHFDSERHVDFRYMASEIRKRVRDLFDPGTEFIAEPGRFFAGPAGTLITQVVGRTFRNNRNCA